METFDAIKARRDIRGFTDRPITPGDLERILEAGRRTPSSVNWQPWDLVVVTDRAQLRELAKVFPQGAGHVPRSAATIALIAPVPEDPMRRDWVMYDFGQLTMSIMIAAADLGIGSGHAAVINQDLARTLLGLPADRWCVYLVPLGYPSDRPLRPIARPNRRPLDQIVHHGTW